MCRLRVHRKNVRGADAPAMRPLQAKDGFAIPLLISKGSIASNSPKALS
jgi:hypothetical protein